MKFSMRSKIPSVCHLITLIFMTASVFEVEAQVINPEKRDTLLLDANGNMLANPGDSLRYILIVTNTNGGPISTVVVPVNSPDNTSLNVGSIKTSPLASNDGPYAVTGNVDISVSAANGILANDFDDCTGCLTINSPTVGMDVATAQGGSINIAADGSFTYSPPAGFQGMDSVVYSVLDGTPAPNCPNTNDAVIRFTISDMIWFVNENISGGGNNGTLNDPFETLAALEAINGNGGPTDPAVNQPIFLYSSATPYSGGITLENGQQLLGQGMTSSIPVATGITFAPMSLTLPTTGLANPVIVDAAGAAVQLGSNNDLRGFDIGSSISASAGAGIVGSAVGDLSVSEDVSVYVGGAGSGPAVDLNGAGTLSATFANIQSTQSTSEGIDVNSISGGAFTVTNSTSITNSAGTAVDLTNSSSVTFSFNILNINNSISNSTGLNAVTAGTINSMSGAINGGIATAVFIDNVVLGMTLTSVTSQGGTLPGIDISNTTGQFTVVGDGSDTSQGGNATGGTISGKTGANGGGDLCTFMTDIGVGILLRNVQNIVLRRMQLNNFSNWAIWGSNVNVFDFEYSTVSGVNGDNAGDDEGSIAFCGLIGSSSFLSADIEGGFEDNLSVENTTGTLDSLIVESSRIGLNSNAMGNDGILVEPQGSATINMRVSSTTFVGARGDMIQVNPLGNSTMNVTIESNTFFNTHGNIVSGGGGITISGGSATSNITMNYTVDDNDFTGAEGNAITAVILSNAGMVNGIIRDNRIGTGVAASGSIGGAGISVGVEKNGMGGGNIRHVVEVDNNTIQEVDGLAGIDIISNRGTGVMSRAELFATISDNNIFGLGGFAFAALNATVGGSGAGDAAFMCLNINGNTFNASGAGTGGNAVAIYQLGVVGALNLPMYAGSANGEFATSCMPATASAGIHAYLVGRGNTMINGAFPLIAGGGVDASSVCSVGGAGTTCP